MNVADAREKVNVLPMFGEMEAFIPDPLEELLNEAYLQDEDEAEEAQEFKFSERRNLVLETQFPDQSLYVLDKQLEKLRESLKRIKFYLGDIDDLLPNKN